jgi:methyltransferase (TIGR00027 family)
VFELDAPSTQRAKRRCLDRHQLHPTTAVVYVPCDLEHDSPATRLAECGFDRAQPCLVVWLGVSYYLTREALDATVADIATFSSAASRLVLDYMDPAVIDGTTSHAGARRLSKNVARRGEPYQLGFTPGELGELLARAGFAVRGDASMEEIGRRLHGAEPLWCRTDDFVRILSAERT